ncbi:MAG: hydantoinase/oxoprolinase [Desulfobulbus propionicus]|nr:MAG: hydantoinase/oxoprolinase [Desulfobulbus propionicus]
MHTTTYCIGIDTGGTYTDAVLMDTNTRQVLHQIKVRTTHNDLSIGVSEALAQLLKNAIEPSSITRLAVSTTLATNAIVEGRGAKVALFVLGTVRHFKLPIVANIFLKGGHTITGDEAQPLDMEELIDTLQSIKNEVESYAVCGSMSIHNPTHELVVEKAISLIDPEKPVFSSHRISSHPGMHERSATACLHAKLQPLMVNFLASIQRSMLALDISCPVAIICGNASGATLDETIEKAAITMASGPAATAMFGAESTPREAIVVDVGGTTTDICLVRDSAPIMSDKGCQIGKWTTHVQAVDMYTAASGGDSHVNCDNRGRVSLHPYRVLPLAMTSDIPSPTTWLDTGKNSYLVLPANEEHSLPGDNPILAHLLANGPSTPTELAEATSIQGIALEKRLEQMAYNQQVILTGFTPTDALHVFGELALGDKEMSTAGAKILAEQCGLSLEMFCQTVLDTTKQAIENIILTYLVRKKWSKEQSAVLLGSNSNDFFSLSYSLHLPIIGIGAAARSFLPDIAKRLHTTVTFPEHYAVGNAIGAALIGLQQRSADK